MNSNDLKMYLKTILLLIVTLTISCSKSENPCDILVNGVYQFPDLPEGQTTMTPQEIIEYWDLPEDICGCITTDGLVETCFNYPDLRLIMAGNTVQVGYNIVRDRFRGLRELESRSDRSTYLLKKYNTVNTLGYDPSWDLVNIGFYVLNNSYVEIVFSQYVYLNTLTKQEKIELLNKALVIYQEEKGDTEHYGLFGLECTMALTGRLMYQDNYEKLVSLYNSDELVWKLIEFDWPVSIETVDTVYNLSQEYLQNLKNNSAT